MPMAELLMDPVLPGVRLESAPRPVLATDRPERVLVVEDDDEMRSLIEETLLEEGYRTAGAADTFAALIELLGEGADVVVTDWKMPVMDGLDLLASVRRSAPGLPVIFITAHADDRLHDLALARGAASFLAKPFRREELLDHVRVALAGAGSPGRGRPR